MKKQVKKDNYKILWFEEAGLTYSKKDLLKKRFANIIKSFRRKNNLSQTELSEMLNIKRQSVSKWERGINLPSSWVIIEVMDILCNEKFRGW